MYSWIDAFSMLSALSALLIAAAIDYNTLRIPNCLTFPMISLGFLLLALRCAGGYPALMAALICAVSYVFVYGLWLCGLWGGGDAKLVLGLYLLISPAYPPLSYIAAFSLCLAAVLLIKYFLSRQWRAATRRGPMGPSLLLAYVISVCALAVIVA